MEVIPEGDFCAKPLGDDIQDLDVEDHEVVGADVKEDLDEGEVVDVQEDGKVPFQAFEVDVEEAVLELSCDDVDVTADVKGKVPKDDQVLDVHVKLLVDDVLLDALSIFEVVLLLNYVDSVVSIFVVVLLVDDGKFVATMFDVPLVGDAVFVVTILDGVLLVHDVDSIFVVVLLLDDVDEPDELDVIGFATVLDVEGLVGDVLCKLLYENI